MTGQILTLDEALQATIPALLALLDALPADSPFLTLDPPQRRQRTLDGLKRLLTRESQVQPLLLVCEDLHWIDTETQALLDSLVESVPTTQLLLLVNYRPEYQHGWGSKTYYRQLRLDPLPPASADEFLQALLGDDPSLEPLKQLLIARTGGNPFFLDRQALDVARRAMASLTGELRYARFGQIAPPAVMSRSHVAWSLAELGGFAEGRSVAEDAVRLAEAVEHPNSIGSALRGLGLLYRRQGDIHKAIPMLERSLALSQHALLYLPVTASLLGAAYTLAGRAVEALPLLDQVLERVATGSRMFFQALVLTELSEALLLVGRVDEASALAGRLLELSRTHTGHGYQAHACRLLGEAAMRREPPDVDQAAARFCQALALAEELGMHPLQAHCHLGLGTLYTQTGQRKQAHVALSAAIDLYRAMDMTFWLPQAEAALAQVDGSH